VGFPDTFSKSNGEQIFIPEIVLSEFQIVNFKDATPNLRPRDTIHDALLGERAMTLHTQGGFPA
jgi:hypothetical protein